MTCISTVDLQTKMEVHELLSRFCHYLDHGKTEEWSQLFTTDAVLDVASLGLYDGRDEIAQIPQRVTQLGDGFWRHHLSNVMFTRTEQVRELEINAYCLTTDWSRGGALVNCADFRAILKSRCHWQVHHLVLTPVADGCVGKPTDPLQRQRPDTASAAKLLN
jgi:3-phenylpropionate/cinnamic acid dioxygenase small subunit